ncbi:YHYH protein [Rhizobiaceae bacterium]|nr:YHYH protein [Rhizobiaceae bacterium]
MTDIRTKTYILAAFAPLLLPLLPGTALAHDPEKHCAAVEGSVADAGFSDSVRVECDGGKALIISNTYPDHTMMTGIVGTNEQVPVPAKDYAAPIPLEPVMTGEPITRDAALGVAVNGVPIYDYTGGGEMSLEDLAHHQAQHDTLVTKQLDVCGGHAGRGDDYHYHVKPTCMIEQMKNAGDAAIIGWAFDGFPIYGDNNPDGTPIAAGELDVCNGKTDETFSYRYHTSQKAPYIVQCLMGAVADLDELPRVSPLTSADRGWFSWFGAQGKSAGKPPSGGVENLTFTDGADGRRSLDYTYKGEAYYMRYEPADTPDCYAFETKTVTDGGSVETGTYCR